MGNPKVRIGSLSGMHSAIAEKKKKKSTGAASHREQPTSLKSSNYSRDDSDSDSSSSSSGSDSDLEAARAKLNAKQIINKTKTSQVNGESKKATNTKSSTNTTKPANTKPAKSVYDFDSDSGTSSSGKATSKVASTQKKTEDSESESGSSESESESESDEGVATATKAASKGQTDTAEASKKNANKSSEESESSSSSSEVSSDSDSDEDESATSKPPKSKDAKQLNGDAMAIDSVDDAEPEDESLNQVSRLMLNGSDFTLRKASTENPGKEVANFFSNANLEGKQLWYFTAPADLPITVLKDMEIDLAKAANGQSILNYKGDAYGIDLEADATSTQISLLIPSKNGDKYTAPNRGVESIIHLRRSAKFGPGNTVSATATDGYAPIPKPIRQQPEGLKARFTPLGVPTPAPTISSQPSAPSSAQPRPRAIPKHMHNSSESSSSDSDESESSSDEEMGGALSLPPKASQSTGVNGNGKRKLSTHKEDLTSTPKATSKTEEKPSKRAKVTSSGDINKTKFSSSISSSQGTPSQAPKSNPKQASSSTTKSKSREKKETKGTKEKTPMKTSKTPSKQTPIPIPTNPLMKR